MSRWNIRPIAVFGTAAVTSLAASMLMASSAANADSVWYQAYERASQDAACAAPADETPWQTSFSGQKEWTPSWQQWANGGKGGWVCQRAIAWAESSGLGSSDGIAASGAGCVRIFDPHGSYSQGEWVDFAPTNFLAEATVYVDSLCVLTLPTPDEYSNLVYATTFSDAQDLCPGGSVILEADPEDEGFQMQDNPNVWLCDGD